MRRDHLLIASLFLLFCSLPASCGSGGGTSVPRPVPAACSEDRFRPNYCGDLESAFYFAEPVITYRIMGATNATDIYGRLIPAVQATENQAASIREGFQKWQSTLGTRRQLVEVPATDPALIDVVIQTPGYFQITSQIERQREQEGIGVSPVIATRAILETEPLGTTATYINDVDAGTYGRVVVRLRSDLEERRFRYVALHEEGHALGLSGHSRRFGDVMYPVALPITPIVEIQERDRNTIAALYENHWRAE